MKTGCGRCKPWGAGYLCASEWCRRDAIKWPPLNAKEPRQISRNAYEKQHESASVSLP